MGAIGGYFELELSQNDEYHQHAVALNTGRNAFEYILRLRNYRKLYIPFFTCDVLLEPLAKLEIEYEFYKVNERLEPVFDFERIKEDEGLLYTNYFGLKDQYIEELALVCHNLILDNAQAFFSLPIEAVDTFYTARKFFGVGDGAYVYTDRPLEQHFDQDVSFERMEHLLIRADKTAEAGYSTFASNDQLLCNLPIRRMSVLTRKIMQSVDYAFSRQQRRLNFLYLHERLGKANLMQLDLSEEAVPMFYPFWTKDSRLKRRLLENRIYCPTYWPNVEAWCEEDSLEVSLMREVVYLPIDQRYSSDDMGKMVSFT